MTMAAVAVVAPPAVMAYAAVGVGADGDSRRARLMNEVDAMRGRLRASASYYDHV